MTCRFRSPHFVDKRPVPTYLFCVDTGGVDVVMIMMTMTIGILTYASFMCSESKRSLPRSLEELSTVAVQPAGYVPCSCSSDEPVKSQQ